MSLQLGERFNIPRVVNMKIVYLWSFTSWIIVMNTTMFNVALPTIIQQYYLSSTTASWFVSGYSIVFAISCLTYSRLSDFIQIKKLLIFGITITAFSSILGFLATNFYLLLAARVFQALGASAVPGLALIVFGRYIPITTRGRAMAIYATGAALGFGLGPVIGGLITQMVGYNYLFLITFLVVFLSPLYSYWLPQEKSKKISFDVMGALLTGITFTSLLFFLTFLSVWFLVIAIVCLIMLWFHLHLVKTPFIQIEILTNRQYIKLIYIGFSTFLFHFSILFIIPILLNSIYFVEAGYIGLMIFPGSILSACAGIFIGRIIDQSGNKPTFLLGHSSLIIAAILFALFFYRSPYVIMFLYIFVSLGYSNIHASTNNEITRILPQEYLAAGLGFCQLVQFFGGAFGVNFAASMLVWQETKALEIGFKSIFIVLLIIGCLSLTVFFSYLNKKCKS